MIWPRRRKKHKPVAGTTGPAPANPVPGITGGYYVTNPGYTTTPAYSSSTSISIPFTMMGAAPVPDPPLKDMGLAIEPIVGLRSYNVDPDGMYLMSFNGTPWPQREPLYGCCGSNIFTDHEVPSEHCACGIYAWNCDNQHMAGQTLYGEVYLWGDVLVCETGYRAEVAYPKNLTITAIKTRSALRVRDGLQEAYGVPVTIVEPGEPQKSDEVDLTTYGTFKWNLSS